MNFTIFGYPKSGKTTLFNLLTGADIEITGYDTGKKEPNLRTCPVPDPRLDKLCALYPDKEKKPAMIDYIDLAGITLGEVKTEGYLNFLRKADGLAHVVRAFQDIQITHHTEDISPQTDIQSMEEEILLADLFQIESRAEKLEKDLKRGKTVELEKEQELMDRLRSALEKGTPLRELEFTPVEEKLLRSFAFLSQKPLFFMLNLDEGDIPLINSPEKIIAAQKPQTRALAFCGKIELEIRELDEEEKTLFLDEYGMKELSNTRFLRTSYDLLDVITFFTIGNEEVKAWTIRKGSPAFEAAGEIHSDIQKGFIRAEVISWQKLLNHGSFQSAREKAAARLEGKNYPVQDGDVIFFRFSK